MLLIVALYGLLHLSVVQTWLAQRVANDFSNKLHTKVKIEKVDISFYDRAEINGVVLFDQKGDTLLAAGLLRVTLNDWFFLKDSIIMEHVEANDVYANRYRVNKTWNDQFLNDYFSGGTTHKKKSTGQSVAIAIKEVDLKNIRFRQSDQWTGEDMNLSLKQMHAEIKTLDLEHEQLKIDQLQLTEPTFYYDDYHGNREKYPLIQTTVQSSKPAEKSTVNNWLMSANKIQIINGSYHHNRQTERGRYKGEFDGLHFGFDAIHANFQQVALLGDTITTNMSLSTKELSGFEVSSLTAKLRFTPAVMEFNDLDLKTPQSHIQQYYAMHYNSFTDDMSDYINKIVMSGRFSHSTVHTDDIAYFAPALKDLHQKISLDGEAEGTVEKLLAKKIKASWNQSEFNGDLAMEHLTDLDKLKLHISSDNTSTNFNDVVKLSPSVEHIKLPDLKKLGQIQFKGKFDGTLNDFFVKGNLNTALGNIQSDLHMQIPEKGPVYYNGQLSSNGFKVGQFILEPSISEISLHGSIEGKGADQIKTNLDVQKLILDGNTYQNIAIDGTYTNNKFEGSAKIDDPKLKISDATGFVSFEKNNFTIDATANIDQLSLKAMNVTNQDIQISAKVKAAISGSDVNHFNGYIAVNEATIGDQNNKIENQTAILNAEQFANGDKKISLHTNQADAEVIGQFDITRLPDAFKVFLNRYYPNYIDKPGPIESNQNFSFQIQTRNFEPFLPLIDSRLSGGNEVKIKGKINLSEDSLHLDATIPSFGFDKSTFSNIDLQQEGNDQHLKTNISIEDIAITDSFHLPGAKLQIYSGNDSSIVNLKTSAEKTLNEAELNASFQGFADGFKLHFSPSSFIINDKQWTLEKDGEIVMRKKFIKVNDLRFNQDEQQIQITTELDDETNEQRIVAILEKIKLGDFVPLAFKDPAIGGTMSGKLTVKDPMNQLSAKFEATTDRLSINEHQLGNINISSDYTSSTGMLSYDAHSNDTANIFQLNGKINLKDSSDQQIQSNLNASSVDLSILNPYLSDVFDAIEGKASTKLVLSGNTSHPVLTGEAIINNASIKPGFTQCRYYLENQTIELQKDQLNFPMIILKDSLGNSATLNGSVKHDFFDKIYFDQLQMESAKISLLNTKSTDNAQFYGNVMGKARMNINGPLSDLRINIDGVPSVVDSSHIYISTGESRESNKVDYIEFIRFGSEDKSTESKAKNNILVNLQIKANPSCKVDVILDEQTGDVIKGEGNGLLNISVGNVAPLTITGNYELTKGEYTFNFQTFLKKPFTLNKGSIHWNGDPYTANIDINAEYLAKNVDISSLSETVGLKKKEDLKILSHLTGILQNPLVKFDFELPEGSELKRDEVVVKRLAEFKNDDNEMNKQVAGLLLFNTFITGNQNFLSQGNANSLISNTIGGAVSNLLTNMLNRELEKATRGILSTYIDINPTLDLQSSLSQLQANIRAGLKILLSNRLVVLVGGNLDYNNPTYAQQLEKKGLLTPDITIEWLINKDGTLRIVGFNRSSMDITLNQRKQSGLQLSYRKDLQKLSDIFKKQKETK